MLFPIFSKPLVDKLVLSLYIVVIREEYASKEDLRDTSGRVMEALHRLEDKLDKVLNVR